MMGSQEYVSLFFKRETAERFQSIRQELGFESSALLEHFFNLYEKNKESSNVQDVEISTTCEPEISGNLGNLSVDPEQYQTIADTLDELRNEVGEQLTENNETARALVSLQDTIAGSDDHTTANPVVRRPIQNIGVQVTKRFVVREEMPELDESSNIEIQLIDEDQGANVEIDFCDLPEPNPSAQEAENIQDEVEKNDQSQSEPSSDSDEFLNKILESESSETTRKRNPETNTSGRTERKRKRRNDVWLTRTQDTDFEERRYKCNFCSAAFFHPHHLQRHEKKLHKMGKQIKPNQCQDCFKTFATPLTLKYHKDFACKMVQRPHRCLECQLGFKSTEELKNHKCSGDPAKPLCCMDCNYRTGSPRDLEHHHRIHTGERCYKCELCDFQTAWKKNLKEHILKHSGLKPFVCNMCNFASNDRSNLRTHLAKHFKNLSNNYDGCSTPFSTAHSSESHTSLHSYATPHKCVYCDYSTKSKFCFDSHMINHQSVEDGKIPIESNLTIDDNTLPIETMSPRFGTVVQKSFFMCRKCGFFNDDQNLFDTHKCKMTNSSETVNPSGETVIEIIESSDELPTVEI